MAQANKKHIGAGSRGKRTGTGAKTMMPAERVGQNEVLSNRDKAQHTKARGLDSKAVQSEQDQDIDRE